MHVYQIHTLGKVAKKSCRDWPTFKDCSSRYIGFSIFCDNSWNTEATSTRKTL